MNSRQAPPSSRLSQLPAPVHGVHEKFKHLVEDKLKHFFQRADDALFDLADKADSNYEQNLFFDSMREIRVQRHALERGFLQRMDDNFAQLVHRIDDRIQRDTLIDFDNLSVVRNEELEEMVALDQSVNQAMDLFGTEIQQIGLRLDSLVPTKVHDKNNPVGPHCMCEGFIDTTRGLEVDIKAKLILFKLFDKHVMHEMSDVYPVLNQLLIDQRILPSIGEQKPQGENHPEYGRRASDSAAQIDTQSYVHTGNEASQLSPGVMRALEQLLGQGQSAAPAPQYQQPMGQPAVPAGSNQLLGLLNLAQQRAQEEQLDPNNLKRLLNKVQEKADASKAVDKVDTEVVNLVTMLFEFVLNDRTLAPEMKALLGRLQIPMVKVGVVDKSFFTKGGHPARRLLNEMASAALGWEKPRGDLERDPLYKKISAIVENITVNFATDVSIFHEALSDFSSFRDKEERRRQVLEQRTLDAEDGKAKAAVARQKVAKLLESKTAGKHLPPATLAIIHGPWSNYLLVTGLKQGFGSDELKDGVRSLNELIWSSRPVAPEHRAKLIKLIPNLLKRLRAGMDSISFNPYEMSDFFKSLEEVHLARIRNNPLSSDRGVDKARSEQADDNLPIKTINDGLDAELADDAIQATVPSQAMFDEIDIELDTNDANDRKNKSDQVAVASAADKALKVIDLSGHNADPAELKTSAEQSEPPPVISKETMEPSQNASTTSAPSSETAVSSVTEESTETTELAYDDPAMLEVDRFVQGAWFEMYRDGDMQRSRLAAFIKPTAMYIFVNRSGMKVGEYSKQDLAQMLKAGDVRTLDNSMLFDRALETVVSGLRKT